MRFSGEEELALRLCGSAERRRADMPAIERLAQAVDPDTLLAVLESQRVVALAGTRLEQLAPGAMPERFRGSVARHIAHNRHRGALFSHLSLEVCNLLEAAGIHCVQLKGAALAERAYGDLGLRSAQSDIDILVDPNRLREAIRILEQRGYHPYDDVDWGGGLPHYHSRLAKEEPLRVSVEVHWRLHWYEERFAREALGRAHPALHGEPRLQPTDEITLLLLVFARDGFIGLRLPADIAAWWDRHGRELAVPPLNDVIDAHPRLRNPLIAAADVLEREVGIPANELVKTSAKRSGRVRLAGRLAQWSMRDTEQDLAINITLCDLLLTPWGAYRVYWRHYFFQPMDHYLLVYDWPSRQRLRNHFKRFWHASGRAVRAAGVFGGRLWRLRGGRSWADLPEFSIARSVARLPSATGGRGLA